MFMADNDYAAALAAAQELDQYDDETLIRELGKRVEDAKLPGGEQRKLAFQADFVDTSATQGWDFLDDVGRTWRSNMEKELMEFLCPKDNAERDKLLSGKSIPEMAASLATAGLIALYAAPPAWAIVVTTLVARKIVKAGIDAWCQVYYKRQASGTK
jgi:hypothetical protein